MLREEGFELAAVQNHFSLIRNDAEQQRIIEWCHENNKTYFSYMVLEQGALGGKYDDEHKFPVMSLRGIEYNGKLKKLRPLIDLLRELGKNTALLLRRYPLHGRCPRAQCLLSDLQSQSMPRSLPEAQC